MRRLRIPDLARNPISWAGGIVATTAAILFIIFFILEFLGFLNNPYIGIVIFVAIPAAFVFGLLLIPAGMWWANRRNQLHPGESHWPIIDFGNGHHRRVAGVVFALTVINALIVSLAAYGGVHYMESREFCGEVCHTPMEPQYVAYKDAPHSRVECVDCHVGSGAGNFIRAKANGTRQLWGVITGDYGRPIPTPVHNMRPARETCEQCHWPEKFHGDKPRTIKEYADDETNSETVTTFQMHVGGGSAKLGIGTGIHWHMNVSNRIEYVAADPERGAIPFVRLTAKDGTVTDYTAPDAGTAPPAEDAWRRMDCIDCHNQPAHRFEVTPQRAVDKVMAAGLLPRDLPFARREAVAAVSAEYPSQEAAMSGIDKRLRDFFAEGGKTPDQKLVDQAVRATQAVYRRNVFPSMAVKWGTYPNNIGHVENPGCFRCHDDEHKSKDGRVIKQDCELCHTSPETK
jgi:nitrate/TMAO reductase-like tetraheme cytochrome c subunit